MSKTNIIDFWKKNEQFWIPINEKQKYIADEAIYNLFFNYDITVENIYGKIIYLDQFSRHFCRYNNSISEETVLKNRKEAYDIVISNIDEIYYQSDEIEVLFSCMVVKHLENYELALEICEKWLNGRCLTCFSHLLHFYEDTYKKCYTKTKIWDKIIINKCSVSMYNSENICDYYPSDYNYSEWFNRYKSLWLEFKFDTNKNYNIFNLLSNNQYDKKKIVVSLSGGVDSMVMLMLLKIHEFNDVEAIHINYGNRYVAEEECCFIKNYCNKLDVKLYTYDIEKIKRKNVSREFYESMTRFIRFSVYEYFKSSLIYLGHIIDDVIENIWTNIANCKHIDNLKKMSVYDTQMGVDLKRPFLNIEKKDIYVISTLLKIPYLKNTTPLWSNRGKFRNSFYKSTHLQYGSNVDNKMIEFADIIEKQSKIIESIIYKPIIDSYNKLTKEMNITHAVQSDLDFLGWNIIFERLCHNKLEITKPSKSSIQQLITRLKFMNDKKIITIKVVMKSDLTITITRLITENRYILKIL
jgi:tRNA(Ile)-lysidine synthetase-like protein